MPVFPKTPLTLLTQLRAGDTAEWQFSWKSFLELYHEPLRIVARSIYRKHSGGINPANALVEDIVAGVIVDFFSKGSARYDRSKGLLRTFLRFLINTRIIDLLRKERTAATHVEALQIAGDVDIPAETEAEAAAFHEALAATLIEDLRNKIPLRQFEIFEMVKLKGFSPDFVAEDLGVRRGVVDNSVYKAMNKLREIAKQPEYQEEFYA